jgi:NADPH:quinone reductase
LKAGETLLVIGAASGVGLSAVQLGKAIGARVIAAASSEEKLALARDHGADEGVLHPAGPLDAEAAKAFTAALKGLAPGGIHVVCDILGGPFTEAALRTIAWEGRLLVIGFPAGIAKLPTNLALLKGCQVIGVFYGSFMQRDPEANAANVCALFDLYEAGAIRPFISGRYSLETATEGFEALAGRRAMGKLVVAID